MSSRSPPLSQTSTAREKVHEARLRSVPVQKASTWQKIARHGRGSELFIVLVCGFPGLGLGTQRQLKGGRMHAGGERECCEFDGVRRRSPFLARAVPVTSFSVRSPTKKVKKEVPTRSLRSTSTSSSPSFCLSPLDGATLPPLLDTFSTPRPYPRCTSIPRLVSLLVDQQSNPRIDLAPRASRPRYLDWSLAHLLVLVSLFEREKRVKRS